MADLSKIKLNNTEYNLKDAEARSSIQNINSFNVQIVSSLPNSNINTHTIYFVPKTGSINDGYNEYMYINNTWERIGSTDIEWNTY